MKLKDVYIASQGDGKVHVFDKTTWNSKDRWHVCYHLSEFKGIQSDAHFLMVMLSVLSCEEIELELYKIDEFKDLMQSIERVSVGAQQADGYKRKRKAA